MKKVLITFICLVVATYLGYHYLNSRPQDPTSQDEPTPTTLSSRVTSFQSTYIRIDTPNQLQLVSNLEKKLPSSTILEEQSCNVLISGGFYTEENTHIGLFRTNGQTLRKGLNHTLFNGFFSVEDNTAHISRFIPKGNLALQAGPILIEGGHVQTLNLVRDEPARRIVVATTLENAIVFMVFYGGQSLISGPYLENLPDEVQRLNIEHNLAIKNALNLDGGSHSAFITSDIQLTEIQPMGSYFCVE